MNLYKSLRVLLLLLPAVAASAQTEIPKNYLGTESAITFAGLRYDLVWTAHPTPAYFKQEYLPKGEQIDRFKNLLMLEVLSGNVSMNEVIAAKVKELRKIKETNPVTQYELFENDGEVILDFLLSVNSKDGKKVALVEHNVYRYRAERGTDGTEYVVLFGLSERSYGDDIDTFLPGLKDRRYDLISTVGLFEIPAVHIAQ
ncbi:MAG: hypothetical protein QM743_11015 [Chitinophagaceae bacterium]